MKLIDKLILEIRNKQYKINNAKTKEYAEKYHKERLELEKKLFHILSVMEDEMNKYEFNNLMYVEILPSIIDTANTIGKFEEYNTSKRLAEAYKGVYMETSKAIASGIKGGISFDLVRDEMINRALNNDIKGKNFSDRIWKNKSKLVDRVYRDVYKGVRDGTDLRKLSRAISKDFNTSIYESMRLLQNETTRVMADAQDEIYEQSEVIDEVRFVATLDNNTTDICQSLDGNVYSKYDVNKPSIPSDTHINCRSCYVPEIPNWSPKTRRDNISKKEIEYVRYNKWI